MSLNNLLNKALANLNSGKFLEAIDLYKKVLAKNSLHPDANYLLGTAYSENRQFELGLTYLLKAEKLLPRSPYVKLNLGCTLWELGRSDEALERLKVSINSVIDWRSTILQLTRPMLLLNGLQLKSEQTGCTNGVLPEASEKAPVRDSCLNFQEEAFELPTTLSTAIKPLKVVLLYPPSWTEPLHDGNASKNSSPMELSDDFTTIPYGLMTIAAQVKRVGHDVSIHNLSMMNWAEVEMLIAETDADFYGISSFTSNRLGVGVAAALIRQHHPEAHVSVGGPFATALPKETLRFFSAVDTVVIGEGEITVLHLLERLGSGQPLTEIPGTAWRNGSEIIVGSRRPRIKDLDTLASPFDCFTSNIIMTSRGCPGKCTFCGSSTTWGYSLRFHSVDYCIKMIRSALSRLSTPFLAIKDDTFTSDRRRVIAMCDAIMENNINFMWSCDTRADFVDDEVLVKMRLAGCQMISFGVESGSPDILKSMRKNTTPEIVLEATRVARKYGFFIRYYMIHLNRGETLKTIDDSVALLKNGRPNHFLFNSLAFSPGTEDWEILSKEAGLSSDIFFCNDFPELKVNRNREKMAHMLKLKIYCDIGTDSGFKYSIEELQSAVSLLQNSHIAHLELANAYLQAGVLDRAEQELDIAERLGLPVDGIIKNQRACLFMANSDVENAMAMLEAGLKSTPCRVIEQNYSILKSWCELPAAKRGNPPKLDDTTHALSFANRKG